MAIRSFLAASLLALTLAAGDARAQVRIGGGVHVDFGGGRGRGRIESSRHRHAPPRVRIWVPGCWDVVTERVWVPGARVRVWVPPRYQEERDRFGRRRTTCVSPGHYRMEERPGHFETRTRRVWREGHWR
jgi:hypothetical protein